MGSLRSALDELRVDDVGESTDDELVRDLDELEHASRVIDAERARRLHEVERRGKYALDGHLSPTAWVADRYGVARSTAAASVRIARALAEMPLAREALANGEASTSVVAALMTAREASPEAYARDEALLVEAARAVSVAELRTVVAYWRQRVDAGRAVVDEEIQYERRALYVSPLLDGMVRVDGDLDPEIGQVLMRARSPSTWVAGRRSSRHRCAEP
jgi:hypothetical protein